MPDARFGGRRAAASAQMFFAEASFAEASFVLRRRAQAIRPVPREHGPAAWPSEPPGTRPSPPTPLRLIESPASLEAAAGDMRRPAPVGVRIGVLSDSHGYLDPVVLEAFAGVAHIVHAGDIGDHSILTALESVAPVTAVAGNIDGGELAAELPREAAGAVAGVRFVVGHKRKRLFKHLVDGRDPRDAAPDLVVYGHDHVPAAAWVEGTLFLNPGSASAPDEEDDGPTIAVVSATTGGLAVNFIPLKPRTAIPVPRS